MIPYDSQPSPIASVDQLLAQRDEILCIIKLNMESAQVRMKTQADKHRRDIQLEVGDYVFIKLKPYRMKSVATKLNEKLSPRFFGPYPILERIGPVAYRVELPAHTRIHPVFHVSKLRKTLKPGEREQPLPPLLTEELAWLCTPEDIIDSRVSAQGVDLLVKWQDLPEFEACWMDPNDFKQQFPKFHLEDKKWKGICYSRHSKKGTVTDSSGGKLTPTNPGN